jgi:ribonucleoside-diphosphate reductase alpha chain
MALKGSGEVHKGAKVPAAEPAVRQPEVEPIPKPIRLPEIMSCLRIRQITPFGNMHVKVSVDPISEKEREVFAQLGKGGDIANSDLEAICRLLSLWLRANGSLELALSQLKGIGSSLTVPTKDGRIMSLGDGLANALQRYLAAKKQHGLKALLLGTAPEALATAAVVERTPSSEPRNVGSYKVKCPACSGDLAFQEGCVKCHGCGFSQC